MPPSSIGLRSPRGAVSATVMSAWAVGSLAIITASIWLCGGRLIYTLDDPYIHLAVAETILTGGYGINISEHSSPSSSIIYPFLLALTELLALGAAGPLAINLAATSISVALLASMTCDLVLPRLQGASSAVQLGLTSSIALALALASNALALPMTGMEHSLQVLVGLAALHGLVSLITNGAPSAGLILSVVLLPLVRFEGIALALGMVVAIAMLGHARLAVALAAAIICALAVYALYMTSLGLPVVPSSVLLKSAVARSALGQGGIFDALLAKLKRLPNQTDRTANVWPMLILTPALLPPALQFALPQRRSIQNAVAFVASAALCGHLLGGEYGWFYRYEVYALSLGWTAVLLVYVTTLDTLTLNARTAALGCFVIAVSIASWPYLKAARETPAAARGIYDQQFQMHRFAAEYLGKPVAVNDLGLVSYRNDNFVLDLWGLGSEPVRQARAARQFDTKFVLAICEAKGFVAAMIYESWFPEGMPQQWVKVATLRTKSISAGDDVVSFYATKRGHVAVVGEALRRLRPELPSRVTLALEPASVSIQPPAGSQ